MVSIAHVRLLANARRSGVQEYMPRPGLHVGGGYWGACPSISSVAAPSGKVVANHCRAGLQARLPEGIRFSILIVIVFIIPPCVLWPLEN